LTYSNPWAQSPQGVQTQIQIAQKNLRVMESLVFAEKLLRRRPTERLAAPTP
jgi:hypothetical protein